MITKELFLNDLQKEWDAKCAENNWHREDVVIYGIWLQNKLFENQKELTKTQGGNMVTDQASKDPNYPIQKHGFKDENEEIQYLGQMITATRIEDKQRLESIAEWLFVLSGASQRVLGTIEPIYTGRINETADSTRVAYVRGLVNKYRDVDLSANPTIAYLRELVCDPWEPYFDPSTANQTKKGQVI